VAAAKGTGEREWIVRLRCVVTKEIVCRCKTAEEARTNPWDYAEGPEIEVEQMDWEVLRVVENR